MEKTFKKEKSRRERVRAGVAGMIIIVFLTRRGNNVRLVQKEKKSSPGKFEKKGTVSNILKVWASI